METMSLIAETQEFRAEQEGDIQGYVLESKIRKGLGRVILAFTSKRLCLTCVFQARRIRHPASGVP